MEREETLEELILKLIGGFEMVFITLSIGIITNYFTKLRWVDGLIDSCIIGFGVILFIIKGKMDKKAYIKKKEKEKEE